MKKVIGIFLLFTLIFHGETAFSQVSKLDSLQRLLPAAKSDSNAVLLYIDLGQQYEFAGEFDSAANWYLKAQSLSRDLNYLHGLYYSSDYYAGILYFQGRYDSAITVFSEMMEIAGKQHDAYQVAIEQWNLGVGYTNKGFNETALSYFMESLAYFERENYREEKVAVYNLIQALYGRMDRPEDAIKYGAKSLALLGDTFSLAYGRTLMNLSTNYYSLHPPQYEKAMDGYRKVLRIATLKGNAMLEHKAYLNMANVYSRTNRTDECEKYNLKALEFFTESKYPNEFCIATIGLAKAAFFRNDFKKAEELVEKDLEVARRHGIRVELKNAFLFLWELSNARHDYKGRNRWRTSADSMQNIIVNENILNTAKELEIKHETEKKELRIADLEKEKMLYLWLGLAVVALVLLAFGLLFARYKINVQKRRFSEQKIKQLEQEKQLIATQSLLDGETQERTRLARDLHDGLGSILAAAKYNLADVKKTPQWNAPDVEHFDKALSLLDDSMREMRRVAHHLMPESLSRYGLKYSLTDFCSSVPHVKFTYYGDETRLDPKMEVMVYRIMHELVNNALKHSDSQHILVQIVQDANSITLTVQDDGCGFDAASVPEGMGLDNIRTRVAAYKGELQIDSKIGVGTEIIIELKL